MFQYYSNFAVLFHNCYDEHGVEIFDAYFKNDEANKNRVLSFEDGSVSAIICDFFNRFYIPFEYKEEDFQAIIEQISYDFCRWMFNKKLTSIEVTMVKKSAALRRNLIEMRGREKKGEMDKSNQSGDKDEKDEKNESQWQEMSLDFFEAENEEALENNISENGEEMNHRNF